MFQPLTPAHRADYLALVQAFYGSDAVDHPVPLSHAEATFDAIVHGSPYLAGYLFLHAGQAAGYALLMKTWSQEAGGLVIWLDELYIAPAFQCHGLGSAFLRALPELFPNAAAFRLELTPCNQGARNLYSRMGYAPLSYEQMILQRQTQA